MSQAFGLHKHMVRTRKNQEQQRDREACRERGFLILHPNSSEQANEAAHLLNNLCSGLLHTNSTSSIIYKCFV